MRTLVADVRVQWLELDRRIAVFDAEFTAFVKENEDARRLTTIPGVGVTIASALIAAIGNAEAFEHGRDLAAWLGLVPRQSTTGGKPRLFGISKRGNKYLRKLLIHGARAALPHIAERDTALGRWAKGLLARAHQECRRGGVGEQAGADRLGGLAARGKIHRRGFAPGGIGVGWSAQDPLIGRRCLRVVKARWPDSRTAFWKPGLKNGA